MSDKRLPEKLNTAQKRKRINEAAHILESVYPEAECALKYQGEPWKLLVMGRLSAQCTDKRVNIVCQTLFSKYPTPSALASAPLEAIEELVRPCGLYKTKARNLKDSCVMLCDEYNGVLPSDMNELLRFPGVGRKIANLLRGDIFGLPAIVADTHCMRICGRLGMYEEGLRDAQKVEAILSELVEAELQTDFCHRIVMFGRDTCTARSPFCDKCPLCELCVSTEKKKKDQLNAERSAET